MTLGKPIRNVVLIGSMGCGKSSVGREIARRVRWSFVDTDQLIRQKFGKSIPEIFSLFGENSFRDEEHASLQGLQSAKRIVLATGGGIVVRPENHRLIRQLGPIVWLVADEEVIWERVSRNQLRPLLQTANPRVVMRQLIEQRKPLYQSLANHTVDSTGSSHAQVAEKVLSFLKDWQTGTYEGGSPRTGS
jgi:shikimate kinase